LFSSPAESDGVENFDDSKLAAGRRVSLSAIVPHAGVALRRDRREPLVDIASNDPTYMVPECERKESLPRTGPARMREVGAMSSQDLLRKDVRRDLLKPGLIRN
jgi:hypothetical protein